VTEPAPLERLATEPRRFGFDAAVRVLLHAAHDPDPAAVVRFRSIPGLAYPPADVVAVQSGDEGSAPRMTVSVMGLTGASGVLPRGYTELLNTTLRERSPALHDFLDMLSHRMVALFARAGAKYRPHLVAEIGRLSGKDRDPMMSALLALTGHGTRHMADRLAAGTEPLLHYAGFFAARPRSVDRLQALVSDWLGRQVEVRQFAGAWLPVPPEQRTRLAGRGIAGRFDRLGRDAAIGVRAWDVQAAVVLRVGPLDRAGFEALLPDRPALGRLVSLVRAFLGFETAFSINPVLSAAEVPPLRLRADSDPAPRLGWNTWLTAPAGSRRRDADDPVFQAEVMEARIASVAAAPR
jgi:type VI secretion system protein ImpH